MLFLRMDDFSSIESTNLPAPNQTADQSSQAHRNQPTLNGQVEDQDLRPGQGKLSMACIALNTFGSKKAKTIMPANFQPNDCTVILGRGTCSDSPGNQQLRLLVQSHLREYLDARDKLGKSVIVSRVLEIVRQRSPQAAFVKLEKGRWVDVGERTSREKVGAMFRDCLGDKYKSSSKTKTAIREQKKRAKQQGEPKQAPGAASEQLHLKQPWL